jgi:hypothetical protein
VGFAEAGFQPITFLLWQRINHLLLLVMLLFRNLLDYTGIFNVRQQT